MGKKCIDPDNPLTWPNMLRDSARGRNILLRDEILSKYFVRTYHATRLLPHEIDDIEQSGLQPLSKQLIQTKMQAAISRGYIDSDILRVANTGNAYSRNMAHYRDGLLCSVLGRSALGSPAGISGLMGCWGGEAMHCHDREAKKILSKIGRPYLIVIDQDLSLPEVRIFGRDSMYLNRGGSELEPSRDIFQRGPIPPSQISQILEVDLAVSSGEFPELNWAAKENWVF